VSWGFARGWGAITAGVRRGVPADARGRRIVAAEHCPRPHLLHPRGVTVVCLLRTVIRGVTGFTLERCGARLRASHDLIGSKGSFIAHPTWHIFQVRKR